MTIKPYSFDCYAASVIICNVDCDEVHMLYKNRLAIALGRPKAIGDAIKNSRAQHELLIVYDGPEWCESWTHYATQKPDAAEAHAETGLGAPETFPMAAA